MTDTEPEPTPEDDELRLAAEMNELPEDREHEPTGDEPEEPTEPIESPDEPEGMTERQLEAARKKIEAENTRHNNRISEIMGEEAQSLEPCPLCSYFVGGLRFPVVPPVDVVEAVRVAIGLPDLSNYHQAVNAHECGDCGGLGWVKSGSLVTENVLISCALCRGSGYLVVNESGERAVAPAAANGHAEAPLFEGVNPDDPAVQELRSRGFTVIPPMPVGAT